MRKLPNEKQIQNAVLQWLNVNRFFSVQLDTVGIYDPVKKIRRQKKKSQLGTSDIWAVKHGVSLALEIKTEYNKLKLCQREFLIRHARAGGISGVIRNLVDMEDLARDYHHCLIGVDPVPMVYQHRLWSRKMKLDFEMEV